MDPKSDRIQSKQRHRDIGDHAMIFNLVFIYFDYQNQHDFVKISFGSKSKP